MSYRRIIFKLYALGLRQVVHLSHCREQFGLFYRIDTQIRFHIEVELKHIFRVTGLFRYQTHDFFRYRSFVKFLGGRGGNRRRRLYRSRYSLYRCSRGGCNRGRGLRRCRMQMTGSRFIDKSLRGFHHQSGSFAGLIIIFYSQSIIYYFKNGVILVGSLFKPLSIFGLVHYSGLAYTPSLLLQSHRQLGAESRRQS